MKEQEILVTVLMPVYNGVEYIREAIDSILDQTFKHFELVIVNDGSTDETESIIKSYTDTRIKLINQQNGGVSAALNTGLKHARAKYIVRFDADDVSYRNRLEVQYNFMLQNPDYILVGSDADYMTKEGTFIYTYKNVGHTNEEINQTIVQHCSFIHSSVIYLKDLVISLGGYDVRAHTFEDYFLWKKLIKKGKVCNLRQPLLKVRFNSSSVTIDEKDHDPAFIRLKRKALSEGKISEADGNEILEKCKGLSKEKKENSYNRMLGKKFLWDNYKPKNARQYLWKSIKAEPLVFSGYLLIIFSFFPESVIKMIYENNKVR